MIPDYANRGEKLFGVFLKVYFCTFTENGLAVYEQCHADRKSFLSNHCTMTKNDIQLIRSLADKKGRTETGLFLAEGAKLVEEMLASELEVERVLAVGEAAQRFSGEAITLQQMARITALKTPTEVVALVRIPRYTLSAEEVSRELILVLDGVQDPGNMGTILRLADWFGIRNVVCSPHSADCFNPKVVQATMGAISRVRVHYRPLEPFLEEMTAAGVPVYGTFLDGRNIYEARLSARGLIVMGNEGRGISEGVARCVSDRLYIPPYPLGKPSSESLNVAVATAIVCAEFRRPGR